MDIPKRNNQKKLPVEREVLRVKSVFKTIQGEGPFSGQRALFIRLYGCNLQCPFCDTEYLGNHVQFEYSYELLDIIRKEWEYDRLIVITGGEPFRQPMVANVIDNLAYYYNIQIETNGTLPIDIKYPERVTVICSPKTPNLHPKAMGKINHYKYVIQKGFVAEDGLPTQALGLEHRGKIVARPPKDFTGNVYIQPMDMGDPELNRENLEECIKSCYEHGYILQQQLHKQIGVE